MLTTIALKIGAPRGKPEDRHTKEASLWVVGVCGLEGAGRGLKGLAYFTGMRSPTTYGRWVN